MEDKLPEIARIEEISALWRIRPSRRWCRTLFDTVIRAQQWGEIMTREYGDNLIVRWE